MMEAGGATRQLRDFASLCLSTRAIDWNSPEAVARISSMFASPMSRDEVVCSIPSMSLRSRKHHSGSASKDVLEQDAAFSMNESLTFPPRELHKLSSTVANNIMESFMSLVHSRLRSTVQALWSHASNDSTNRLAHILRLIYAVSGSLVQPGNISNSIRVVGGSSTTSGSKTISKLVVETVIQLNVLDQEHSILLTGSGTIAGILGARSPSSLTDVVVSFDVVDILRTMMSTARDTVKLATNRVSQLVLISSTEIRGGIPSNTLNNHFASQQSNQHMSRKRENTIGTCNDEKTNESRTSDELLDLQKPQKTTHGSFSHLNLHGAPSERGMLETGVMRERGMKRKSFSGVDLLRLAAEYLD